jgi:hypothetical protein
MKLVMQHGPQQACTMVKDMHHGRRNADKTFSPALLLFSYFTMFNAAWHSGIVISPEPLVRD